jgi:mRNA interferase RelE/StbE
MNQVTFSERALKQLRKIDKQDARIISEQCESLARMPNCKNVKTLTNHKYQFRLRVGRFRVFFNFDGVIRIVAIKEIKKRDENTY